EDVFMDDGIGLAYIGEKRGLAKVTPFWQAVGTLIHISSFVDAQFQVLINLVILLLRVDGADISIFIHRITHDERFHPVAQLLDYLISNSFLHQQSGPGAAHMTLIKKDGVNDAFYRLIDGSVFKDDIRSLAAQFERISFVGPGQ